MARGTTFLVTCEHGGNRIPPRYARLFHGMERVLDSHRGHDRGSLQMARELARALRAPLVASTVSRLLVDLNRSLGHPRLWSDTTRELPLALRREILERHYLPYRNEVEGYVGAAVHRSRRVVHVSCHSFTPNLDGDPRNAEIGLLYDPSRDGETELCRRWQACLRELAPHLRARRNYPYAGKADGLTTHLRRRFPARAYLGIELEINQALVLAGGREWKAARRALIDALRSALDGGKTGAP